MGRNHRTTGKITYPEILNSDARGVLFSILIDGESYCLYPDAFGYESLPTYIPRGIVHCIKRHEIKSKEKNRYK